MHTGRHVRTFRTGSYAPAGTDAIVKGALKLRLYLSVRHFDRAEQRQVSFISSIFILKSCLKFTVYWFFLRVFFFAYFRQESGGSMIRQKRAARKNRLA